MRISNGWSRENTSRCRFSQLDVQQKKKGGSNALIRKNKYFSENSFFAVVRALDWITNESSAELKELKIKDELESILIILSSI